MGKAFDRAVWEERLIGQAWTKDSIYENLEALCDFGGRFAGTAGEAAARAWLEERFRAVGLSDVHLEWYDYNAWERGPCQATMVFPTRHPLASALALVYAPATPPSGLEAKIVDVQHGSAAEFDARAAEIPGNIVLADSGTPYGYQRRIHRREKYMRAVKLGAVGFIFSNHLPGQLAPTGSLQPGQEAEIPAIGVSKEDGLFLRRHARRGEVRVNLQIGSRTYPARAAHVVGGVPAAEAAPHILIGAHYDGHDIAESAMDNGSGVALLLALAELFAPLAGTLRNPLRFVALGTEELGLVGSMQYVNDHRHEINDIALMINLDSGVRGGVGGFLYNGFTRLAETMQRILAEIHYPLILSPRIISASDNMPFVLAGVPALNPFRRNLTISAGRGYGHTIADTLDKVEERDLRENVMVLAQVLLRLALWPGEIAQHLGPEALANILRQQNLEESLRLRQIWPDFGAAGGTT